MKIMPSYLRADVLVYIMEPVSGALMAVKLGKCMTVPTTAADYLKFLTAAIKSANNMFPGEWRGMSKEEVTNYIKENAEDEDQIEGRQIEDEEFEDGD